MRYVYSIVIAITLIILFSINKVEARTITVPDDYPTIQEAIDNASDGDTIIVRQGTYNENVKIDKNNLVIKSESGPLSTIINALNPSDHVFKIIGNGITISGFTIQGAISNYKSGISVSSDNILTNNIITANYYGIQISSLSNNLIVNNTISSNNGTGIYISSSSNNLIANNTISSNNLYGISVDEGSNNVIANNTISNNNGTAGIRMYSSLNNIIVDNTISSNEVYGIYISSSSNNLIANNTISSNNKNGISMDKGSNNNRVANNIILNNNLHGIRISESSNNLIANNTISNNNNRGITVHESSNNVIANNTISNNRESGISFFNSANNTIYLNCFIDNTQNVYSNSNNQWHSNNLLTYQHNNKLYTSYLGNYYSDYNGSDDNDDGIGDTQYSISNVEDNYPLINCYKNYIIPQVFSMDGFNIPVMIINGRVENIKPNVEDNSLEITLSSIEKSTLTIEIPRSVLDSKSIDGNDKEFVVLADGILLAFNETRMDDKRVLTIAIPQDTDSISIRGTHVIPEFGVISMLVLASMLSIIALNRFIK